MNNFFGKINAEWVDPAVELPPDGWYTIRWHSGQVATSSFDGQRWGYPAVSAWLRIGGPSTALPAPEMIAAAIAHRSCGNEEQDMQNGKLAGYCIVCGVPWPCDTARAFLQVPSDAIPRAQVQAAVDEMTKYADEIPGTRCARGLKWARQLIKSHTGVTPKEVQ